MGCVASASAATMCDSKAPRTANNGNNAGGGWPDDFRDDISSRTCSPCGVVHSNPDADCEGDRMHRICVDFSHSFALIDSSDCYAHLEIESEQELWFSIKEDHLRARDMLARQNARLMVANFHYHAEDGDDATSLGSRTSSLSTASLSSNPSFESLHSSEWNI